MDHIKEFVQRPRGSRGSCCWRRLEEKTSLLQSGRVVAHIRHLNEPDEIADLSLAAEIELLEGVRNSPPLFVSCYTLDTPYENLAKELTASLNQFNLPHRIEPVVSTGSWVANTNLKAATIKRAWLDSEQPVCWIDADAEVLRLPHFIFDNPFDIAIVRRDGWHDLSGFVYLAKTQAAKMLIEEWANLCARNTNIADQVLWTLAWYNTVQETPMSTLWLNEGIFRFPRPRLRDWRDQIFYYPYKRKIRPFIDQKQASRKLKSAISSKNNSLEFGSPDISDSFRNALQNYNFDFRATASTILSNGSLR